MSELKPVSELTDPRLMRRLALMSQRAVTHPDKGFPQMMDGDAELEAAYRFFDNERVTPEAILAPHFAATVDAAARLGTVIVSHDSSWLQFGGEKARKGLGRVGKGKKNDGLLGHLALCLSADGCREPLGILGLSTLSFDKPVRKRTRKQMQADPLRKSLRWGAMVAKVEARLAGRARAIHVMDREADDYALFDQLSRARLGFVIRLQHDRSVREAEALAPSLRALMATKEYVVEREVPLSHRRADRRPPNLKQHPARVHRLARLAIRAATVELARPEMRKRDNIAASLTMNVVQVVELDPPPGEPPVEWLLFTQEPVTTAEQVAAVVDAYRARWTIEEFFKALKTGCAYEERQLETRARLENALAFLSPIAVGLLRTRNAARDQPDRPALEVLTPTQFEVLRAIARKPLAADASAHDALLAIAALGGHLKRNGWPGWQTLYRGYETLRVASVGWVAARAQRSDQS